MPLTTAERLATSRAPSYRSVVEATHVEMEGTSATEASQSVCHGSQEVQHVPSGQPTLPSLMGDKGTAEPRQSPLVLSPIVYNHSYRPVVHGIDIPVGAPVPQLYLLRGPRMMPAVTPGYALLADEQEVGKHQDSCEQGQYENSQFRTESSCFTSPKISTRAGMCQ